MQFKSKLLASAVAFSTLLAAGVEAAQPPVLDTYVLGGLRRETTAKFRGGATLNGGASFQSTLGTINALSTVSGDLPIDISGSVEVDPADVGQDGDLFMVVETLGKLHMLTTDGFQQWNFNGVDASGLLPFATRTLGTVENYSLTDLEARLGQSLDGQRVIVYLGYMSDTSKLNYSVPFRFRVNAPASGTACPAGISGASITGFPGSGKRICVLQGTYTSDLHLTSNFDYMMQGTVFIGGDNTNSMNLIIDAGTTIYGQSGPEALVINRGSKIYANGTPAKPVVMTAAADGEGNVSSTTRGQWGGLVINGNASVNGCVAGTALCELEGEGNTGQYGGNNDDDSSGSLTYLQVKYAGYEITPENELNGIAFQGVGRGTLVDYIQVHNNFDDGVEFYGGTVNAKHIYLSGNGDDSMDWTFGWRGKVQHVVVVQTDRGDQGIEADNNAAGRDSLPRSKPMIANMTLIGNSNTDTGVLLREGTGANLYNFIVSGFGDDCIDIDHSATFVNAGGSASTLSGELTMTNSVVNCTVNFREEAGDNFTVEAWFTGQAGNSTTNVGMTSYINSTAANARPAATLTDPFFDQVDYIGAVKNQASDWTAGWTHKD